MEVINCFKNHSTIGFQAVQTDSVKSSVYVQGENLPLMTMLLLIFNWQLKNISQHEVLEPSGHLLCLLISVQSHFSFVF